MTRIYVIECQRVKRSPKISDPTKRQDALLIQFDINGRLA